MSTRAFTYCSPWRYIPGGCTSWGPCPSDHRRTTLQARQLLWQIDERAYQFPIRDILGLDPPGDITLRDSKTFKHIHNGGIPFLVQEGGQGGQQGAHGGM